MNRKKKGWIVWVGLGLMILAMACYVLSLDESDPDMVPRGVEAVDQPQ